MKRFIWIIIPFFLIIGFMLKGRRGGKKMTLSASPTNLPLPVEVTPVKIGKMNRTLEITGSIKVDEDVDISSKIIGRVSYVAVKEGDSVRQGQVLVRLDDKDLRAQVQQAAANVRFAAARVAQLRTAQGMRFSQTDTRIAQARANLDAARVRVSQLETQAQMTATETSAQVDQAEATLAAAKQRVAMLREGTRKQEKAQSLLAVAQAKANYENARAYYERRRQLYQSGAVSKELADEAERQCKVAEAQYKSAQQQSELVHEGPRTQEIQIAEEDVRKSEEAVRQARSNVNSTKIRRQDIEAAKIQVRQAEADLQNALTGRADIKVTREEISGAVAGLQQAQAGVALAKEQLRNTAIACPVAAVVTTRKVHVGQMVIPGMTLLQLVAPNTAYYEGIVSEVNIASIQVGLPVEVAIDSLPGRIFTGRVSTIIPVASNANRSFRIRVSVAPGIPGTPRPAMKPGSFARGEILLASIPKARIVPKEAVIKRENGDVVYVIQSNVAKERKVIVGVTNRETVEITSGVEAGDLVVVRGADALQDGSKVKVVTSTQGSRPQTARELAR